MQLMTKKNNNLCSLKVTSVGSPLWESTVFHDDVCHWWRCIPLPKVTFLWPSFLFLLAFWDWYFCSGITFLENPFSFSVTLKTSLEPLRTIFPWCPLGLHVCSGQCPFNQEKCLRRCGIRNRNGSLTLTQTASSPLDELSWQIAAVGIIGLYRLAGEW